MNKRGFTLIEVLLSIMLGAGVLATMLVIPNRMVESYAGYMDEVAFHKANSDLSLAINEDLSQALNIKASDSGFAIGEHVYQFTEAGVFRQTGESTVPLTDLPLAFEVGTDTLRIYNTNHLTRDENRTNLSLTFPLRNSNHAIVGGGFYE